MASHPFRQAVEARDAEAMVDALAPDVVLHSPVTFKPFEGRDAVRVLLTVLLEVFEDFRYTDELAGDGAHGLISRRASATATSRASTSCATTPTARSSTSR
jgi:ketosteroid isomerase-like protein